MSKAFKTIQSIQRAIDIIECFDVVNVDLKLKDISGKLDLNINTTRGIVKTLVINGYMNYDENTNLYSLGYVFIPKSDLIKSNNINNINSVIKPYLKMLADKYSVNCRCQIISQHNIFSVSSFTSEKVNYAINPSLNVAFPYHASASGKVFLAYLNKVEREERISEYHFERFTNKTIMDSKILADEIQKVSVNGYAVEIDEYGEGISCIATPLVVSGKLYATISIMAVTSVINEIKDAALVDMIDISESVSKLFKL